MRIKATRPDPFAVIASSVKTAAAFSSPKSAEGDCGCGCSNSVSEDIAPVSSTKSRRVNADRQRVSELSSSLGIIAGRRNIVDLKAAARASDEGSGKILLHDPNAYVIGLPSKFVQEKTGLVRSNSRIGRAAQSAASIAIPGDMSRVRSPIRSTISRALTPGGGRGLGGRIGGQQVVTRCPPGYEHGGRFSNNTFTNCGMQLFEAIVAAATATSDAASNSKLRLDSTPAPSILRGVRVTAGKYTGDAVAISRAADVPRMSVPSAKKRDQAISSVVNSASSAEGSFIRMVRADGVTFLPIGNMARIAKQRNNPDMKGATWVTALNSPQAIGGEEIALFGAGISSIRYAVPGSGELRVDATKPIGQARASALMRKLSSARAKGDQNGSALREMVGQSNGDLVYSESFPNMDKPNELVIIAKGKERMTMPRWIYEAWYTDKSSGKDKSSGWTVIDTVVNSSSQEAIGKDVKAEATAESLGALSSFDRGKALALGKSEDIGAGRTAVSMNDGTIWIVHDQDGDSHIGIVVGNDIAKSLGVNAPNSYLSGEGNARKAVVESPSEIIGVKMTKDGSISDTPGEQLAKIVIVDYLTNNKGRTPATVVPAKGKGDDVISMSSSRNLLAGVGGAKLPSQQDFPSYLKQDGSSKWLAEKVANMEKIKEKVAAMYEQLLQQAEQFDWDAYIDRLAIAGLTDGEKTHLGLTKKLYELRVNQMRSSRKTFLSALGVIA